MWEADESRLGPPCARIGDGAVHRQLRGSAEPHYPGAQRIKRLAVSAAPALRQGLPSRDAGGTGILPCVTPLERFLSQTHVIA